MIEFLKQYIPLYKNYKLQFVLGFAGMLLVAISTSSIAYLVKPILDEIFINKDVEMLQLLPILVIVAYFGKSLGTYLQAYYISFIGKDIIRIIRDRLLKQFLILDIEFFYKSRSGELISRIVNDINRIQEAVSTHVAVMMRETMTAIGLLVVVIYQSPELAFYSLVVLPLSFYPLSLLAKRMKRISFKSQEKNSDITSSLSEIFNNIEIIKAHTTEEFEKDKFKKHNLGFFKIEMKGVATQEAVSPLMEMLGSIAAAIVITIGGMQVINGELSIGAFFSFMTALFMLYNPIRKITAIYNKFQDALAANDRINHIFELKPKIVGGSKNLDKKIESIHFRDVCLSYDLIPALSSINFEANIGEKIALVGSSGSGKSSFVNLLMRFYDPSSGEISINEKNIKELSIKNLREKISIVTQRVYIFNDTVASNVAYGKEIDRDRVVDSLKKAHAYEFVEKLESGIDTVLDEFGSNLSGGQRQRVAIARAIYTNPDVIIFDEATSALDNRSEQAITEAITEISKDKIVFIIAHRLSTIEDADKIVVFKDGAIICEGSEENLIENCKEYQNIKNRVG